MGLTLDGEGRVIHGPKVGMIAHLLDHGGVRMVKAPRRFPPRRGRQLVLVLIEREDLALWITDRAQFDVAKETPGLKVWLDLPSAPLLEAERKPLELPVDDGPGECPDLVLLGGFD
jgi:hypothetical protein